MATLQEKYLEDIKKYSDSVLKSQIVSHEKLSSTSHIIAMALAAMKAEAKKRNLK